MDMMQRRAALIGSLKRDNVAYEAYNLSFDGTDSTVINTGVYLFTAENIDRDFEFVAEGINGVSEANNTIVCAKHNGRSLGFLIRVEDNKLIRYNGTLYAWPVPASIVVRRINGQLSASGMKNPGVALINDVFDWPLVLGCAIDDDGTLYRFKRGTIDHVKVTWL